VPLPNSLLPTGGTGGKLDPQADNAGDEKFSEPAPHSQGGTGGTGNGKASGPDPLAEEERRAMRAELEIEDEEIEQTAGDTEVL